MGMLLVMMEQERKNAKVTKASDVAPKAEKAADKPAAKQPKAKK